ncbi:DUF6374 family protein [Nocardia sp. NPDC050406]|uniref:DUF6374 family protein n=1 Tax=Nocardia sp. NPDC050406 TaxID=3364318 RepID=UPI0037A254D8
MPELTRLEWARMNLDQVRRQLLDAAAFGKYLTPEQLEHAAGKIGEGLRIYVEETGGPPPPRRGEPAPNHGRMQRWVDPSS